MQKIKDLANIYIIQSCYIKFKMSLLQNILNLSTINLKQNQFQQASERLSSTIQSIPQNSFLFNNRAIINFGMKKTQQARNDLQKSITLSPLDYLGYYNAFGVLYKLNKKSESLQNLIYAISVLYIKSSINNKSTQTLRKAMKLCYFFISNDSNRLALVKLSLNNQIKTQISSLSSQKLQQQLKLKLQEFKNILRVVQSKNIKYKVTLANPQTNSIIFSQKIIQEKLQDSLKILSELKKIILQEDLIIESKNKKNDQKKQQNKNTKQCQKHDTEQNNQHSVFGLNNRQGASHILHLESQIKPPSQNQLFSPKKKQMSNDDSFNINQMSLKMKKSSPQQQINSSYNNISSTSYKKNKGKKNQELYPLVKKNQDVEVKIVMAQITNNKELIGKMDPYCVIQYNGQSKKTSVITAGGTNPRWNEIIKFKLTQKISELSIKVYDRERFKFHDDFVGQARFILQKNGFVKLPMYQKEIQAGFIFISVDGK